LEQKQNTSSSEIEQKAYRQKKMVLRYVFLDDPKRICKIMGKPEGVLKFFRSFEKNPNYKIISLEKAFQLKDVPGKIWRTAKKIRYIPMYLRSKRNEIRHALKETCQFGPRKKDGDN